MKIIQTTLLLLITSALVAQTNQGEKVMSLNAGFSWTGLVFNTLTADDINLEIDDQNVTLGSFNATASPAIGVTFDYGITNVFSLGALVSRQVITGEIGNYSWQDLNGNPRTESLTFNSSRNNISLVPRFHYKLKSENVDLYSGLKLGFTFWRLNVDATDRDFDVLDKFTPSRPSLGLIPIGARFYMSDNFGLNVETAIGAPYVASIGAQYRF